MEKFNFDEVVDRKGTACIKWDCQEKFYGTSGLLPFSIADADYPVYQPILDALKKRVDNGVLGYTDLCDEYISAVAEWAGRRHGWKVEPCWIVPTEGLVPSMANAIEALTGPDDGVIVQPPVYDPFYSITNATGRRMIKNDLLRDEDGYRMDFEGLEKACAEGGRILLLCSPHNPVCRLWSEDELRRLAGICARHGTIILSDEIHWDLTLGGRKHFTMGLIEEVSELVVVCTSCSKTFNIAGLETSNLIIPGEALREKYMKWLYSRYMFCPNVLGMEATKVACQVGDEWVDAQAAYLTQNAEMVCDFMAEHLPKVKVAKPEATYLLWFDMTAYGLSGDELVKRIADAGAGVNSGLHYGEDYDGFVRMNVACPKKQLSAGLECIKKALDALDALA